MKTVLILDHFDSFTYNLVQYVEERGYRVKVIRTNVNFSAIQNVKFDRLILLIKSFSPKFL